MSEPSEMQLLLMAYLDEELDAADRARVEAAIARDPALRQEFVELQRLQKLTDAAGLDARSDADVERFWGSVYNRLERHAAWMLILLGAAGVASGVAYLIFTAHGLPRILKLAAACAAVGGLLLIWSVWRERLKVLPHDRYSREVRR